MKNSKMTILLILLIHMILFVYMNVGLMRKMNCVYKTILCFLYPGDMAREEAL